VQPSRAILLSRRRKPGHAAAVEVPGGHGFPAEFDVERYYRDAP